MHVYVPANDIVTSHIMCDTGNGVTHSLRVRSLIDYNKNKTECRNM